MKIEFNPEAEKEFREAARYYESEAPGIGLAFIAEVHRSISELSKYPLSSPVIRGSIRKKVLNTFPFSILYSIEPELILVIAVAHHRRRPTYWRRRVRSRR